MPTYEVRAPNGRTYRIQGPAGASQAQIRAEVLRQHPDAGGTAKKPTSFWQGVGEGLEQAAGNALRTLEKVPLVGDSLKIADVAYNAMRGRAPTIAPGAPGGQAAPSLATSLRRDFKAAAAKTGYRGSTAGRITGNVIGTLPAGAAAGGMLMQGGLAGALSTANPDDGLGMAKDAAIGAGSAKVGEQLGKRVIAPVAERVGRTKAARSIASAAANAMQAVTGKPAKMLPNPKFTAPERMVNKASPALDDVRANVTDAADLGLPYSLADASPELRTLAGSVARKSPAARAIAERNFNPRALGQADRAVKAIDDHLAPITNLEQRAGDIRKAAQTASQPFYDEARAMAAPVDDEISAALGTPAGKKALQEAYTIAANEGRDPHAIGLAMDDAGNVTMGETPTFETLQLVKRGLDAQLAPFRNQITNKLELEGRPDAQAISGLLERFNSRLKQVNDPYRQGNEAYSSVIRRRDALNLGEDMAASNVPQRQFEAGMSRMDDVTMPEMQRGYATSMADTVNRQRLSSNPYNSVYGSPLQQGKVGALFPEGAPKFGRQYELEGQMAATRNETLGGSPTQARNMADQLFDAGVDNAGALMDVAQAPGGGLLRLGARAVQDRIRTGGEKKAAEIAPTLFDTNDPKAVLSYLNELAAKNAEANYRRKVYRELSGLIGVPAAGIVAAK